MCEKFQYGSTLHIFSNMNTPLVTVESYHPALQIVFQTSLDKAL